jgi:Domain of unknown function (DUF4167)
MVWDQDQTGLAVALTRTARSNSNHESRKTIRHFDSNGPNIKIRGSAYQIFERYLALAREATASGDRIAAENFYQHAEHYFRINNARREGNQQGTPPRPTTPADVEMNSSEADSREVDQDRFQPQWDGDDSVSSETPTPWTRAPREPATRSASHQIRDPLWSHDAGPLPPAWLLPPAAVRGW